MTTPTPEPIKIEPSESWGKHWLGMWLDGQYQHIHTDYTEVIHLIGKRIAAAIREAELRGEKRGRIAEAEACCKLVCNDCKNGLQLVTDSGVPKHRWRDETHSGLAVCEALPIRQRITALRKEGE